MTCLRTARGGVPAGNPLGYLARRQSGLISRARHRPTGKRLLQRAEGVRGDRHGLPGAQRGDRDDPLCSPSIGRGGVGRDQLRTFLLRRGRRDERTASQSHRACRAGSRCGDHGVSGRISCGRHRRAGDQLRSTRACWACWAYRAYRAYRAWVTLGPLRSSRTDWPLRTWWALRSRRPRRTCRANGACGTCCSICSCRAVGAEPIPADSSLTSPTANVGGDEAQGSGTHAVAPGVDAICTRDLQRRGSATHLGGEDETRDGREHECWCYAA